MDSSSIVCVADTLLARGTADTPRLDTLSYYDDSEPNWNERPYIAKVEEKRGQTGRHIDISEQEILRFGPEIGAFAATPSSGGGRPTEASRQFAAHVAFQGNRVILSGIGGDETTGGVPTPVPELMIFGHSQVQVRKPTQTLGTEQEKTLASFAFGSHAGIPTPASRGRPEALASGSLVTAQVSQAPPNRA